MADDPNLRVKVTADTSEAESSIEKLAGKVGNLFAGYLSAKALIGAVQAVTHAANESNQAVQAFNLSLAASGKYSNAASQAFQDYASKLEMTTGIQDDLILKNAALLVSVGRLSGEGLNKATKAALDLAAGLQIDVGTAFNVMAKAAEGNVMGLAKYGLEVRKGATDSEKFAAALQFVNNRFGDMSTGNLKTWDGVMNKVSNGFEKFEEAIGKMIINSPKLRALLTVVADGFYSMAQSIEKVGKSGHFMDGLIDKFFQLGKILTDWVLKPIEVLANFLGTFIIGRIAAFMQALAYLAPLLDKVFHTDYSSSIQQMADTWKAATLNMAETSANFDVSTSQKLSAGLDLVKQKVNETASQFRDDLIPALKATTDQGNNFWSDFGSGFTSGFANLKEGLKSMSDGMNQLGQQVKGTFVSGFSNAFATIGKNLVAGRGAFSDFGKALLSMLGSVAMQMGAFFIAMGTGFLFVPGEEGRGLGLIAAGAGLSLLGGILQALGGAAEEQAPPEPDKPSGGSGSGSGMFKMNDISEREKQANNFTFVVEGNVFDSRETGQRMVDIFHDTFAQTGATLPKGMVPT
jgi:hypothetical protein